MKRVSVVSESVNLCYCDESGTGEEPIAVMVGIVVDCQRMHITKEHWNELLHELSKIAKKQIRELHTKNFYSGGGIWKGMNGNERAAVLTGIFDWLVDRKHRIDLTGDSRAKWNEREST